MPELNVKLGERNFKIIYEDGEEGFIEIQDTQKDISLHVRPEDEQVIIMHFVDGLPDPTSQMDWDSGDVYLD